MGPECLKSHVNNLITFLSLMRGYNTNKQKKSNFIVYNLSNLAKQNETKQKQKLIFYASWPKIHIISLLLSSGRLTCTD